MVGELGYRQAPSRPGEDVQIVIKSEQRRTVPGCGHLQHDAEIKTALAY